MSICTLTGRTARMQDESDRSGRSLPARKAFCIELHRLEPRSPDGNRTGSRRAAAVIEAVRNPATWTSWACRMPALLIRQRVSDYDHWRQEFAKQAHARNANGCLGVRILRNPDDPNETVVILTWDSLVRARLYSQSDDLAESLERNSSNEPPAIWLLEEAF